MANVVSMAIGHCREDLSHNLSGLTLSQVLRLHNVMEELSTTAKPEKN